MKKYYLIVFLFLFFYLQIFITQVGLAQTISGSLSPSCPSNSYFNRVSNACECIVGMLMSGGRCISEASYCQNLYGTYSYYDSFSKTCKCQDGYLLGNGSLVGVLSGGTMCISGSAYCRAEYGTNSEYSGGKCGCESGYVIDSSGQCVNNCQQALGINSNYNLLTRKCECKTGYILSPSQNGCIEGNTYCRETYGSAASYNPVEKSKCLCTKGFMLSDKQNKCIDIDSYCQERYINASYDNSLGHCACENGYDYNSSQDLCVKKAVVSNNTIIKKSESAPQKISPASVQPTSSTAQIQTQPQADSKPKPQPKSNTSHNIFSSVWDFVKNLFK
jgi:hypothetical protein